MKKRQKKLFGILMACLMTCLPVSNAVAATSYDAVTLADTQVLFPNDSLINLTSVIMPDGTEATPEGGVWTNTDESIAYKASYTEEGVLSLSKAGYVLTVKGGTSEKSGDDSGSTANHKQHPDEGEDSGKSTDIAYYQSGDTVKLKADAPEEGMEFAGWTVSTDGVSVSDSSSAETTFTMPEKKVTIEATYQEIQQPAEDPEDQGEESEPSDAGENPDAVTEPGDEGIPSDAGSEEDPWASNEQGNPDVVIGEESQDGGEEVIDLNGTDGENNETEPAVYSVTVNDGVGAGAYAPGETVTVTANDYTADGYVFNGWSVDSMNAELSDLNAATATFLMPESEVALSAHYAAAQMPTSWNVTVNNGTISDGSGAVSYETGAYVNVTANDRTAEGYTFNGWTVNSENVVLDDPSAASTGFTMPEGDVTITAEYIETPQSETPQTETQQSETPQSETQQSETPQSETQQSETPQPETQQTEAVKYNVAVQNGTADAASYEANAAVTVRAEQTLNGQTFDHWEGTAVVNGQSASLSFADANSAVTTFTMPAGDVSVTAVYKTLYTVTVANGVITNAAGQTSSDTMTVENGAQITVTANPNPAGQIFSMWKVNDGSYDLGDSAYNSTVTVNVAQNMSFVPVYEGIQYSITVNDGSSNYDETVSGTVVTITADKAPEGMEFDYWTVNSGNVALADADSATTTFTMPESDVTVSAMYRVKEYKLTVENGSSSAQYYQMGDTVTISSNYPSSGLVFSQWTATSGNVTFADSTRWKTTFTMPASDVAVKATYKNGPSTDNNQILDIVAGGEYYTGDTIKFTASGAGMDNSNPNPGDYRYRPSGYQIGNVTGNWQASPYTTSMAIKATGEYTLKVSYNKEVYDGNSWVADGTTDTKSVTFKVITKAAGVATGDETPVMLVMAIAIISCVLFVILLIMFLRRRKKRLK